MADTAPRVLTDSDASLLRYAKSLEPDQPRWPKETASSTSHSGTSAEPPTPTGHAFDHLASVVEQQQRQVLSPRAEAELRFVGHWEGVVFAIGDEFFEGEFVPVGASEPRMRASFLISEIDDDDLELVRPGALFYVLASEVRVSRRRWQPTSVVQFRRLPRPTPSDVLDAKDQARKLRQKLGLPTT